MSSVTVTIKTDKDYTRLNQASQPAENMNRLINMLSGFSCGALTGSVYVSGSTSDPAAASATLTLVSAIATDAITIGTVTMTATSTPTTNLHWEIDGADDTADAASLAAAINANPTLSKVVVATSAAGVVTVTALVKGVVGNQIPISSADSTITASGAFLTGGTGGTNVADVQVR
jgi:phage tail sheath gpL-like